MVKMLTLFGKDPKEMNWEELSRERRCQQFLLTFIKPIAKRCKAKAEEGVPSRKAYEVFRQDKADFCVIYIKGLEAFIAELDYWMDRRAKPKEIRNSIWTRNVKRENARRRQTYLNDNFTKFAQERMDDGLYVSWDKDKFDLIANDRGYQTDEMLLSAVAEELHMSRTNARLAIQGGRFTWGQVLCLGAMMEMTPKEFCDTFLSGYFVDRYGDYRAEYDNLDKTALLKRAVRSAPKPQEPKPKKVKPDPVLEEIYVDSDGRPLGEDTEWFDD